MDVETFIARFLSFPRRPWDQQEHVNYEQDEENFKRITAPYQAEARASYLKKTKSYLENKEHYEWRKLVPFHEYGDFQEEDEPKLIEILNIALDQLENEKDQEIISEVTAFMYVFLDFIFHEYLHSTVKPEMTVCYERYKELHENFPETDMVDDRDLALDKFISILFG